MDIKIAIFFF